MDKRERLSRLNELIDLSKSLGCRVEDVYFGWGLDTLVVMNGPMPTQVRELSALDDDLEYSEVDFDPH